MLFMGSTEEQLMYLSVLDVDISSYSNVLLSFGMAIFLYALSDHALGKTDWLSCQEQG